MQWPRPSCEANSEARPTQPQPPNPVTPSTRVGVQGAFWFGFCLHAYHKHNLLYRHGTWQPTVIITEGKLWASLHRLDGMTGPMLALDVTKRPIEGILQNRPPPPVQRFRYLCTSLLLKTSGLTPSGDICQAVQGMQALPLAPT